MALASVAHQMLRLGNGAGVLLPPDLRVALRRTAPQVVATRDSSARSARGKRIAHN